MNVWSGERLVTQRSEGTMVQRIGDDEVSRCRATLTAVRGKKNGVKVAKRKTAMARMVNDKRERWHFDIKATMQ